MPVRPNPEGWPSPYPYGHADPCIEAVVALLSDWFNAMERGDATHRLPDPNYQRSGGRPVWTEAELDAAVRAIDAKVDRELSWAGRGPKMLCTAGPGFVRLPVAQRLALAQQLDSLLATFDTAIS